MHAIDKLLGPDVNLEKVARKCLGMSGADLANVLNEAAIISARKKKD